MAGFYHYGKHADAQFHFSLQTTSTILIRWTGLLHQFYRPVNQVFEPSGKFITKFGKQGNGPGEFKAPISTAVLSELEVLAEKMITFTAVRHEKLARGFLSVSIRVKGSYHCNL